jgi:hypothetical protein
LQRRDACDRPRRLGRSTARRGRPRVRPSRGRRSVCAHGRSLHGSSPARARFQRSDRAAGSAHPVWSLRWDS